MNQMNALIYAVIFFFGSKSLLVIYFKYGNVAP